MPTCHVDRCHNEGRFILITYYYDNTSWQYAFKTKTLVCEIHAMYLDDGLTIKTKVVEYPIYRGKTEA